MTATAPGPRAEASGHDGVLPLAAALLLALSGLLALPGALLTQAYYTDTWEVAALAGPASVLPTLVLVAAAVARGSRVLLLVASGVTVLHLAGSIALATAAANGPESPLTFLSSPIELGVALAGIALGWWDASRTERRPAIALTVVVLAPVLGLLVDVNAIGGPPWYFIGVGILVLQDLPAILTVLAAGLVCLPARGARIGAATLIGFAGLSLLWAGPLLDPAVQLPALRLAAIAAALLCAVVAAAQAAPPGTHREPDGIDRGDIPAGRALVDAEPTAPGGTLPVAALTVLVLTVALAVPDLFAHGPGIQPGGAGPLPLIGFLVQAALPAALTLAAGAAALGSRRALVVASTCLGLLAVLLLVSRTAADGTVAVREALPFVALGLSLALAWAGAARPGPGGTALRWTAVVPLLLAASPTPDAGAVVAAALLGTPHRAVRVAAAVLLCLLALGALITLLDYTSALRGGAVVQLLRVGGYGVAAVLAAAAVLPPPRQPKTTSAQL